MHYKYDGIKLVLKLHDDAVMKLSAHPGVALPGQLIRMNTLSNSNYLHKHIRDFEHEVTSDNASNIPVNT